MVGSKSLLGFAAGASALMIPPNVVLSSDPIFSAALPKTASNIVDPAHQVFLLECTGCEYAKHFGPSFEWQKDVESNLVGYSLLFLEWI
jgi:hypothetical protein